MRWFGIALGALAAIALLAAVIVLGVFEGWGLRQIAPRGDSAAFLSAATAQIDAEARGNAAFALIEDGAVRGEHFVSRGRPVDRDTLFQVASLSKWLTAWGVMTLVDAGRVDLDAPVSRYLKRWQLPESAFDNEQVTVRRLLSHTAGLTDGLGYGGFAPGAPIQSLEASLTRASDASPGRDGIARTGAAPGSGWRYSGGGYTILQMLIEDVTGEPFNDYMRRAVMMPLGMTRSTFVLPETGDANLAEFYDADGGQATHYRFTAVAAASLYTSTADMTRFIQAHLRGPNGEPPGRGVLKPETLIEMRQPHGKQYGADIWGLGVILYAPNDAGSFVIGHDGSNEPAINTTVRFDPASGDGIVMLETGNRFLATEVGGDWVFWHTGKPDLFMILDRFEPAIMMLVIGAGLIIVAGIVVGFVTRPRRRAPTNGAAASS